MTNHQNQQNQLTKTCSIFGFKGEKKKFDFDIKVRLSSTEKVYLVIYRMSDQINTTINVVLYIIQWNGMNHQTSYRK